MTTTDEPRSSPYIVRVASCGCVFRKSAEIEVCDMLCIKHEREYILQLYNENYINKQLT